MTKTFKISDWEDWISLCEANNINPYETADFDVEARRQITGGDTIGYEYVGEYPEKEED